MERRVAWFAAPVLAILGSAPLTGLLPGGPPGVVAATADLDWSAPRPVVPCSQPLAIGTGDPARTSSVAWRVLPVLDADGELVGWDLMTAADGAAAHVLRLPPESAVRGPVDGLLAVASDDGRTSEISLVSPRDGCREVRATERRVVRQAVVEPETGDIVYHVVSRTDRSDGGIWRQAAGDATDPEHVTEVAVPLTEASSIRSEIGRVWTTDLVFAAEGGTLAVQSCGEWACRTRLIGRETGGDADPPVVPATSDEGAIVGLDGSTLITFGRCTGLPCSLIATEITGGRSLVLSPAATSATTFIVDGRLVVAAVVLEDPRPRLVAVDPASGRRQQLALVDPWLRLLRAGGSAGGGISAGPGTVPAEDGMAGRPTALDPGRVEVRPGRGPGTSGPGGTQATMNGGTPEAIR